MPQMFGSTEKRSPRVFSWATRRLWLPRHPEFVLACGKLLSAEHSTFNMNLNPSELRQESSFSIFLSCSLQSLTDRSLYKIWTPLPHYADHRRTPGL
ncbi:hypothetical protein M3J09_006726 [Ascochyta lentis]